MSELSLPHFQRLHALFDLVSELPPEEREAAIARSTADAPELAGELRALLEHAARDDSPLDEGAVRLFPELEPPLPQIPGYRVHRCIGRGGSSTVYLADQEHAEFTREVALKVVDRVFDAGSLRSMREEQRILARLEHPGIARLYDAGVTASGQPWLAMEHVEGESIFEHCRSRNLPVRERIALFLSVLDAVAYAHARGIVHRDLKPANIFVDANGETRLLDFGIAKLSDSTDRDETRTLQRALTPAYASPEQLRGDRTSTATDIYSLGVVLYELLTGTLPHEPGIREEDPLPASAALARARPGETGWRALRGDVDAILAKALRLRPEDRYATAAAMAEDLRRVLGGETAAARRGAVRYRVRTFASRHRTAVAVSVALLLFAASWSIAGWWRNAKPAAGELAVFASTRSLRDGAERLARFDAAGARESFRRAAESSRGHMPAEALAWDGVARAESLLGETGRAAEAAGRAAALAAAHPDALPRHETERLRARALAANREYARAVRALEELFSAQPERLDIGLELVSTLLACGRTDAADTALGRLRQLVPPGEGDLRIDLQEAEVALQLTEYQRAAAAAARTRDRAERAQAPALRQRAARLHAEAISRLDRRPEARRELDAILARNRALGFSHETAAAQLALGSVLLRIARSDETRRELEAARAGCLAAGDRRCEISARVQLALVDGKERKLTEGIRRVDAAIADARAIGDRWIEGYALSQRIVLYNWADDAAATDATVGETVTALRDSGNRHTLMTTLANLAISAIEALDLEKAEAYIVESEGLARRVGSQLASAFVDRARGYLEQTRGDYDLARESYTAALEKARTSGVPMALANYLADLAWLEVAADRPEAAAARAREAVTLFRAAGDERTAASTEAVLAWSDARLGNGEAARRRIESLRKAASADGSDSANFSLLGIEARVAAALGDWQRAIELRHRTIRMAEEWNARGLVISQQANLAEALHGAGERRALEVLVADMLPEVERHGLRGVARDLRALVASR